MTGTLSGLHIGLLTASASRSGGGVFEAVVQQARIIRSLGGAVSVFALADQRSAEDAERFAPSQVHHLPMTGPAQIGFAPGLVSALLEADLDLLHLHGIWMYPSRAGSDWAQRTGRPYLVSPHGMLDPWITARGQAKKSLARIGYERASWRGATVMHALTEREAGDIAAESGRSDTIVIPNSGPPAGEPRDAAGPAHFLYLGRIHPKKNIAALIDAWTMRAETLEAAGARLTIAGWGDQRDVDQLRSRVSGGPGSIHFVGPKYGAEKAALMRDARFFVLPSQSEGLPMAVLEAWAAGTPALMSQECNLPAGFTSGAAIDCGLTAKTIATALDRALELPDSDWQTMSDAALELAGHMFSSEAAARQWGEAYRGLAHTSKAVPA
ncbi:glycosyltransferase [Allopontixanthobacter sp.]|uniref:glycosyltransferase n=1 Tax=Allopontixanthobacter sp. TaxID=2906452 RepID=UPI002AB9C190|nr:glycosyltransferase [Allopontixanthobacter sp.]MDZ4307491.1 glycosyltransferase [Allopontixanthobacter sp.]